MMFVSFRSITTGATSRGGTGASTFTFLFPSSFFPFFLGGGVSCCSIFTVTYYFVLITNSGVRHDFNITWCLCRLEVALQVSPVEQELFTGLEHPRSPTYFYFFGEDGRFMLLNLYWSLVFCRSLIVLLFFFFWSLCGRVKLYILIIF